MDLLSSNYERFGTLETDYELLTHLRPERRNMLALQAKIGMGEQQDGRRLGEFTVADLIPEALRQNLSRLIIGEVRGSEAGAMFEAMQAGAWATLLYPSPEPCWTAVHVALPPRARPSAMVRR